MKHMTGLCNVFMLYKHEALLFGSDTRHGILCLQATYSHDSPQMIKSHLKKQGMDTVFFILLTYLFDQKYFCILNLIFSALTKLLLGEIKLLLYEVNDQNLLYISYILDVQK